MRGNRPQVDGHGLDKDIQSASLEVLQVVGK